MPLNKDKWISFNWSKESLKTYFLVICLVFVFFNSICAPEVLARDFFKKWGAACSNGLSKVMDRLAMRQGGKPSLLSLKSDLEARVPLSMGSINDSCYRRSRGFHQSTTLTIDFTDLTPAMKFALLSGEVLDPNDAKSSDRLKRLLENERGISSIDHLVLVLESVRNFISSIDVFLKIKVSEDTYNYFLIRPKNPVLIDNQIQFDGIMIQGSTLNGQSRQLTSSIKIKRKGESQWTPGVSYFEAKEICSQLGQSLGIPMRVPLPTDWLVLTNSFGAQLKTMSMFYREEESAQQGQNWIWSDDWGVRQFEGFVRCFNPNHVKPLESWSSPSLLSEVHCVAD